MPWHWLVMLMSGEDFAFAGEKDAVFADVVVAWRERLHSRCSKDNLSSCLNCDSEENSQ